MRYALRICRRFPAIFLSLYVRYLPTEKKKRNSNGFGNGSSFTFRNRKRNDIFFSSRLPVWVDGWVRWVCLWLPQSAHTIGFAHCCNFWKVEPWVVWFKSFRCLDLNRGHFSLSETFFGGELWKWKKETEWWIYCKKRKIKWCHLTIYVMDHPHKM